MQIVETAGCLHPTFSACFGGRRAALSASICLDTNKSYVLACHSPPVQEPRRDQEEICLGVRLEAPPQGLRKARAWQRVAARPTRLDLKEAFEYASRSFLNAVALCCDLRCKIKQN